MASSGPPGSYLARLNTNTVKAYICSLHPQMFPLTFCISLVHPLWRQRQNEDEFLCVHCFQQLFHGQALCEALYADWLLRATFSDRYYYNPTLQMGKLRLRRIQRHIVQRHRASRKQGPGSVPGLTIPTVDQSPEGGRDSVGDLNLSRHRGVYTAQWDEMSEERLVIRVTDSSLGLEGPPWGPSRKVGVGSSPRPWGSRWKRV